MSKSFPIYTTKGDWVALLVDNYLYNTRGEWIGWIDRESNVYAIDGAYVGWLARDFRVLRKRAMGEFVPHKHPPHTPTRKIEMPVSVPLPPMMAELSYDTKDVFDEMPERLSPIDFDKAQDID
jgi:hypothetical protein